MPTPIHQRANALGLTVARHLNQTEGNEWIPAELIANDGSCAIFYREAGGAYPFAGWEPWHRKGCMWGGRRENIHSALAWIERAQQIVVGTKSNFLGV